LLFLNALAYLNVLNAKEIFLQPFKYNIYYHCPTIKTRVGQLTFGVCCDNLGDEILNKFNPVENKLKEHLPKNVTMYMYVCVCIYIFCFKLLLAGVPFFMVDMWEMLPFLLKVIY